MYEIIRRSAGRSSGGAGGDVGTMKTTKTPEPGIVTIDGVPIDDIPPVPAWDVSAPSLSSLPVGRQSPTAPRCGGEWRRHASKIDALPLRAGEWRRHASKI